MGILDFISNIFKPVADLVDNLHTSDEERLQLRNELEKARNELAGQYLELHQTLAEAQGKVLLAEATGNTFQRIWRPALTMALASLAIYETIITPGPIPEWMTQLILISVPGYMGLRSMDKILERFSLKRGV